MIKTAFAAILATAVSAVNIESTVAPTNYVARCGKGGLLCETESYVTANSWNWWYNGKVAGVWYEPGNVKFNADHTVTNYGNTEGGSHWYIDDEGYLLHRWRAGEGYHKMERP